MSDNRLGFAGWLAIALSMLFVIATFIIGQAWQDSRLQNERPTKMERIAE